MDAHRGHVGPFLGIVLLSLTLHAQPPIITGIEVGPPTPTTPAYTIYELWQFPPRWVAHQPHGSNVCRDVRISFTTEAGRNYWVECGSLYQPDGWQTTWPNLRLNIWRQCSPVIQGTGSVTNWHGGGAFSWSVYRIRVE